MKSFFIPGLFFLSLTVALPGLSQKPLPSSTAATVPWSQQLATTAMKLWPDSFSVIPGRRARWAYDQGVILKGIEAIWNNTGDGEWFNYIQHSMDYYVQEDGTIRDYRQDEYNIDHVNNGRLLILLFEVTGKAKYKMAADLLRNQLRTHPRTNEGGFWHKKIYPYQMWLDGLYMGEPFYAAYSKMMHDDTAFNDIARQFIYIERHARDRKTGLLYHGWDESRQQKWANKETGLSPHFWARALGWYGMAMVDVLDYFPEKHWGRDSILGILSRFAKAVVSVQDASTGLWYDIVNLRSEPKNYPESSASSMLVYTLLKAVRKGYLPVSYLANAKKGYHGLIRDFIEVDASGQTNLKGTVSVSGLGGNPYRDGSFEYYMSEPVVVNDPKGMGAFIQCSVEMEMVPTQAIGKNKTVLLDRYFNSEKRKDAGDKDDYYHYTWEEKSSPGLSMWANVFTKYGARLSSLDIAPTAASLGRAGIYLIIDPDHSKDNPAPNFINTQDIKVISDWVKQGGVLVLMANDSANCELEHFNKLAAVFGIRFTDTTLNMVKGTEFETGAVPANDNIIFKKPVNLFMKDISALSIKQPARAVVKKNGAVVIATATYGKGIVFAVGDPWLYSEYVDGRKLSSAYENYRATELLSAWLLGKSKK